MKVRATRTTNERYKVTEHNLREFDHENLIKDRECWVLFEIGRHGELFLRVGSPGDLDAGQPTHYQVPPDVAEVLLLHFDGPSQRVARQPYRELLSKQLTMINELRWSHDGTISVKTLQDELKATKQKLQTLQQGAKLVEPQLQLERDRTLKLLEQNTEMEKELIAAQVQRHQTEADAQKRILKLEADLRTERLELENLKQQNAQLPTKLNSEREKSQAEVVKLRNQLELKVFEAQSRIGDLQHQLERKEAEYQRVRRDLEHLQDETRNRVESTRQIYDSQRDEDARTMKVQAHELVSIKEQLGQYEQQLANQNIDLQNRLDDKHDEIQDLHRTIQHLEGRLAVEDEHHDDLQTQVSTTVRDLHSSRQFSSELQTRVDQQGGELTQLRTSIARLQTQLSAAEEQNKLLADWKAKKLAEVRSSSSSSQGVQVELLPTTTTTINTRAPTTTTAASSGMQQSALPPIEVDDMGAAAIMIQGEEHIPIVVYEYADPPSRNDTPQFSDFSSTNTAHIPAGTPIVIQGQVPVQLDIPYAYEGSMVYEGSGEDGIDYPTPPSMATFQQPMIYSSTGRAPVIVDTDSVDSTTSLHQRVQQQQQQQHRQHQYLQHQHQQQQQHQPYHHQQQHQQHQPHHQQQRAQQPRQLPKPKQAPRTTGYRGTPPLNPTPPIPVPPIIPIPTTTTTITTTATPRSTSGASSSASEPSITRPPRVPTTALPPQQEVPPPAVPLQRTATPPPRLPTPPPLLSARSATPEPNPSAPVITHVGLGHRHGPSLWISPIPPKTEDESSSGSPKSTPWCIDGRSMLEKFSSQVSEFYLPESPTETSGSFSKQTPSSETSSPPPPPALPPPAPVRPPPITTTGGPQGLVGIVHHHRDISPARSEDMVVYPPGMRPPVAGGAITPVGVAMPSPPALPTGFVSPYPTGGSGSTGSGGRHYSPMTGPAIISPSFKLQSAPSPSIASSGAFSPMINPSQLVYGHTDLSMGGVDGMMNPSLHSISSRTSSSGQRFSLQSGHSGTSPTMGYANITPLPHVASPPRLKFGIQEWY